MTDRAPYSRVYWSIVDDKKFATVFDNNDHLATWLRLLIVADQAHPASANIPHGIRKASLTALVDAKLIDLGVNHRFRVHGLDAERKRRSTAATRPPQPGPQTGPKPEPSGTQTGPKPDPDGFGTQGLRRAEQSRDETSRAEQPARDPWDDPEHEALVWLARHGCDVRPGNGYHRKLVTAVEVHGVNALVGMMDRLASAGTKQGDIKGFLFGAIDALDERGRPSLGDLSKADRADETDAAHKRRLEATQRHLAELRGTGT